jgi:UDP-N-acetyl-D-mannosaminuronic acid dehydrogenase
MIVSVIGLGYIGLPTAAVLASCDIKVIGVDIDQHAVQIINQGKVHIIEPELDALVQKVVKTGYFHATTQPEKADVFMVAVPTPFKDENKPDISYIESVARSIAPVLEKGNLVILESTSPVGTTERMTKLLKEERPDLIFPEYGKHNVETDVKIAYCPERVLPGRIIHELVENDRIIGGMTNNCARRAKELYKIFVKGECMTTDVRTAELCKLVENSYRDVNIAFANELSLISDNLGVDVWNLINFANHHPRVDILQPGPGVGGHCIAVDPWFIIHSSPDEAKLIRTARLVNDNKPKYVLEQINKAKELCRKDASEINITCLGVAFKADIDDLRESPALEIANSIGQTKLQDLYIVEPNISQLPSNLDNGSAILTTLEEGISKADIIVILVDHKEFKLIDKNLLINKIVIDTRGIIR